jgi:hypothetical protein
MPDEVVAKINAAIRTCLERCYGDTAPLKRIADYTAELRHDPTWKEKEIAQVEATVLKMLTLIVEKPLEG